MVFCAVLVGLTVAMLFVFRPFFYPILWAAIMAIMFQPVHRALNGLLRLPALSALLATLIAIIAVLVPLSALGLLAARESLSLYRALTSGDFSFSVENLAAPFARTPLAPYLADITEQWGGTLTDAAKTVSIFLFHNIREFTKDSIQFIFYLFLTIYALFFFFKDGERILRRLKHLSPLKDEHDLYLFERFSGTVRATLKSTIIVGGVQGLLAGFLFWLTDVPASALWAVLLFVFALIPGIGTFIIWFPAGLFMLATSHAWQGITILVVGALVISTIDNLLRPPLLGKETQMHPLLALFSTLGGVFLFGIPGFVIGPVIAALYMAVLAIYDKYYLQAIK